MAYEFKPPAPVECPKCHQRTGVLIARGFPSQEASQLAAEGKIVLGGCFRGLDDPDRECTKCHHAWRHAPAEDAPSRR